MKRHHVEFSKSFPSLMPVPDGKGSWVTLTHLLVVDSRVGSFQIPYGVHNNLASIPRMLRSMFNVNGPHRIAAIVHDYLYLVGGRLQDGRVLTRADADALFYDIMRMPRNVFYASYNDWTKSCIIRYGLESVFESSKPLVPAWKAWLMYKGVRVGGWLFWNKKQKFDISFLLPVELEEEIPNEETSDTASSASDDGSDDRDRKSVV